MKFHVLTATLAMGLAGSAGAHEGGDLMIYDNGSGGLNFGRYDFDGGTGVVLDAGPIAIIEAELTNDWESTGRPGTDEPGWATDGSSPNDPSLPVIEYPFPANTAIIVKANVLPVLGGNAAYWDGSGAVDFTTTMPNGIEIEDGFGSLLLDGGASAPAGTVSPWVSGPDGVAHGHLEFILGANDATAAPGVYLISLSASAGALESDPLYLLFGYAGSTYSDEQIEAAIESAEAYVEANIVPEPAGAGLLAFAGLGMLRRRRA